MNHTEVWQSETVETTVVKEDGKFYINKEGDNVENIKDARKFTHEGAIEYIRVQQMWRDWSKAPHRILTTESIS